MVEQLVYLHFKKHFKIVQTTYVAFHKIGLLIFNGGISQESDVQYFLFLHLTTLDKFIKNRIHTSQNK